jgi:hypothetical protein
MAILCIDTNVNRPRSEWAGIGVGAGAGAGLIYGVPANWTQLWSNWPKSRNAGLMNLAYLAFAGGCVGGLVGVAMQNAVPSTVAPIQQDAAAL